MRVLVTGVTGFVGSHLADYILENHPEVEIHGLKRWRSPMDNIWHIENRLRLYDGDLRDFCSTLSILRQVQPEVIFHLAAQSFVPFSFSAPIETLTTNVIGTANLLEAVRALPFAIKPTIIITSSSEVYGQVSESDIPITEDCPLRPVSPYAVSKVSIDMLGYMYYQAYGLRTVRARLFTHTGPRRGEPFVISAFARQIARIEKGMQEPILKVGNLDSVRTFCDVRDAVRAYWLLLEDGEPGEVYNIGGDETMAVREALELLLKLSPMRGLVTIMTEKRLMRPKDVTLQIPDCTKFKKLTGWEPKIAFRQTLADTLQYWRERIK